MRLLCFTLILLPFLYGVVCARIKQHCSGNGYLSDDGVCDCSNGFYGADCDEKLCPSGKQWFGYLQSSNAVEVTAECSNNGNCNRKNGICDCKIGFGGSACERLTCPKNENQTCSGNGKCINQKEASLLWDGVFLHTLGRVSEPLHEIEGCVCDELYTGYDCSLMQCPYGDYPRTTVTSSGSSELNEIQRFYCKASAGHFRLTHNRKTSNPIPYDAPAATVQRILEMMINKNIEVTNPNNGPVCSSSGVINTIEFIDNSGLEHQTLVSGEIPSEYNLSSLSLGASSAPYSLISDSFIFMITRLSLTCPSTCFPSSSSSTSGSTVTTVTTTCSGGISIVYNGDMSPVISIDSDEDDIEESIRELTSFHLITSETSLWNDEYAESVVIIVTSNGTSNQLCAYSDDTERNVTTFIDLYASHGNIRTRGALDGFSLINDVRLDVTTVVVTNSVTTSTTIEESFADMTLTTPYGSHDVSSCSNGGVCNYESGECNCFKKIKNQDKENFDDGNTLPQSSSAFGYWYKFESSDGTGSEGNRGDCGYEAAVVKACPSACSNHGTCSNDTFICDCNRGYYGGDCSKKTCPMGIPWFSEPRGMYDTHYPSPIIDMDLVDSHLDPINLPSAQECSNMGLCDSDTGKCKCRDGFTGNACQRLACPMKDGLTCSGHGQCVSLRQAGLLTNGTLTQLSLDSLDYSSSSTSPQNGDTVSSILSGYGNSIAYELHTAYWKADKIYGCVCDLRNDGYIPSGRETEHMTGPQYNNPHLSQYYGHDCSKRSCPLGPYPNYPVTLEQQIVSCTGSGYISFRGHASSTLVTLLTTASELELVLNDLITIGEVSVNGSACSSDLLVTFETDFGNLPLIQSSSGNIIITEEVEGEAELKECSGTGKCDVSSGICSCLKGYASSDGSGNIGSLGDCGFKIIDLYATKP